MAQIPAGTSLSSFIRDWLNENGRDLDYRLANGSTVPFDDADLEEILVGVVISGRVGAIGRASSRGHARAEGEEEHRRGPKERVLEALRRDIEAELDAGRLSPEQLKEWSLRRLAKYFGYHRETVKKAISGR